MLLHNGRVCLSREVKAAVSSAFSWPLLCASTRSLTSCSREMHLVKRSSTSLRTTAIFEVESIFSTRERSHQSTKTSDDIFFFPLPSLNWTLTHIICNAFALNFEKASLTFTPTRSNSHLTSLMRLNFGSRWTEIAIVNLNQPSCSSHLGQPTKTAVGWCWFICRTS